MTGKDMGTYLDMIENYLESNGLEYPLVVYHVDKKNRKTSFEEAELRRKKGIYIANPENMPTEIIDGIRESIDKSRSDHALGIFAYFFTPISRSELSERYVIKKKGGGPKQSSVFYVQKHVISPTYEKITTHCDGLTNISVLQPEKPGTTGTYNNLFKEAKKPNKPAEEPQDKGVTA